MLEQQQLKVMESNNSWVMRDGELKVVELAMAMAEERRERDAGFPSQQQLALNEVMREACSE